MKLILDECLPKRLASHFPDHHVATVATAGLSGLTNGRLLDAIEEDFDVFVTIDSNLEYQQTLSDRAIAVIVVRSVSNRLEDLVPLVPKLMEALVNPKAGQVAHVG